MELRLSHLNGHDLRVGQFDKAVLPVSATEFHGDHLPYGTDTIAAETLAQRFAADLGRMVVLPTIEFGVSPHHLAFPWTLSIRPATLTAIVFEVGSSLLRHGVTKLLLVTAHDGNPAPVEIACRMLHDQHGMHVAMFSGWQGRSRALLANQGRVIDLDHGGQSETSMVLFARPELAHPSRSIDPPRESGPPPVRIFGGYDQLCPDGYSGAASQGSADEGAAIVDALAAEVVPFLRQLDANNWRPGPWIGL